LNICHNLEGGFDPVFVCETCIEAFKVRFAAETKNISTVGTSEGDKFA
jgi:hypothetical protein